jgi:phosphoribosylformylglycinamidine (FGAM) synthase PurS component
MKSIAKIAIRPHRQLLVPPGKTIVNRIKGFDLMGVEAVRIGKYPRMLREAQSEASAAETEEVACKKIPANSIMEPHTFKLAPTE